MYSLNHIFKIPYLLDISIAIHQYIPDINQRFSIECNQ